MLKKCIYFHGTNVINNLEFNNINRKKVIFLSPEVTGHRL